MSNSRNREMSAQLKTKKNKGDWKWCSHCFKIHKNEVFYRDSNMASGLRSECKLATKARRTGVSINSLLNSLSEKEKKKYS